jgi:hypothetical protein
MYAQTIIEFLSESEEKSVFGVIFQRHQGIFPLGQIDMTIGLQTGQCSPPSSASRGNGSTRSAEWGRP